MWNRVVPWAIAAGLLAASASAACAESYGYGHGGDYGRFGRYGNGYQPAGGYGEGGYRDGGYGEGGYSEGGYGYGYGSSPYTLPARYCGEHQAYHERQAWLNNAAPYHDWWGAGGPEGWHEAMEEDHARFHYSHPGSWRCEYQGWPSG